jgi:hypothetical protein
VISSIAWIVAARASEGADQRDRHVDHRQDHGPPVLQEQQHDDGD